MPVPMSKEQAAAVLRQYKIDPSKGDEAAFRAIEGPGGVLASQAHYQANSRGGAAETVKTAFETVFGVNYSEYAMKWQRGMGGELIRTKENHHDMQPRKDRHLDRATGLNMKTADELFMHTTDLEDDLNEFLNISNMFKRIDTTRRNDPRAAYYRITDKLPDSSHHKTYMRLVAQLLRLDKTPAVPGLTMRQGADNRFVVLYKGNELSSGETSEEAILSFINRVEKDRNQTRRDYIADRRMRNSRIRGPERKLRHMAKVRKLQKMDREAGMESVDPNSFENVISPKLKKAIGECGCQDDQGMVGQVFAVDHEGNIAQGAVDQSTLLQYAARGDLIGAGMSPEEHQLVDDFTLDVSWFNDATQELLDRTGNGEHWIEVVNDLARRFSEFFEGEYLAFDFASDAFGRRAWEMGLVEQQAMMEQFDKTGSFELTESLAAPGGDIKTFKSYIRVKPKKVRFGSWSKHDQETK